MYIIAELELVEGLLEGMLDGPYAMSDNRTGNGLLSFASHLKADRDMVCYILEENGFKEVKHTFLSSVWVKA